MVEQEKVIRQMLSGFIGDPPDSEFQEGFLAALLTIANEVYGIPHTDQMWQQADCLLTGADPKYVAEERKQSIRKTFKVLTGGKDGQTQQGD